MNFILHQITQTFKNDLNLLKVNLTLQLEHNLGELGLHTFYSYKSLLMNRALTRATLLFPALCHTFPHSRSLVSLKTSMYSDLYNPDSCQL